MMRQNHVRARLRRGEPSVGTWLAVPSAYLAEQVARVGLDWLVVDAEHNAVDIHTLGLMFMAMSASPVAPMVRVPWNTPEHFKRVLDAGAWGVVVPMVCSRAEAELAVEAVRYAPRGNRSVGGGRHAISFDTDAGTYYQRANDEILLVLQLEHIKGVENADEILSVPGVDACFIGPNDLAWSMGLKPDLESREPRVVEAIAHIRDTAGKHGVAPGIHTSGAAAAKQRIAEGFQVIALASELRYTLSGLREAIGQLGWESWLGAVKRGEAVRY